MSRQIPITSAPNRHLINHDRVDKTQNIQARELGVYFKDLRVTGLGASVSYQPTVGSLFDLRNHFQAFHQLRHPAIRNIIDGFDGVVRPGQMLRECLCPSYF